MYRYSIILILFLTSGCYSDEEIKEDLKVEARDSYIEAYQDSRQPLQNVIHKNDRDLKYPPYYDNGPAESYGPPQGYPEPSYPYGPPVYGPPNFYPRYRAYPSNLYEVPHAMMGLFDKLKVKIDIYTILKLILKFVIFKKIVSFVALICLLLFIPKFKLTNDTNEDEDSDSRSFKNNESTANARLNTLTEFVLNAIDKYSKANSTSQGIYNIAGEMYRNINKSFSNDRTPTYTRESS